mmetsp:Transcript_2986/g.4289  ORF Transcript_2986/g.4289 Transcript_2986/m.4289 type:complete len:101 (+) Transcript_2986:104-406(+)
MSFWPQFWVIVMSIVVVRSPYYLLLVSPKLVQELSQEPNISILMTRPWPVLLKKVCCCKREVVDAAAILKKHLFKRFWDGCFVQARIFQTFSLTPPRSNK